MNFIVFDPSFIQKEKLNNLVRVYHITEIYSLLPYNGKTEALLGELSVPISVCRQRNETIDSVKKRAVYSFVSKISRPIIFQGEYTGTCDVSDMFKYSHYNSFSENMKTKDPNILVLKISTDNKKYAAELSTINLFKYIFNILKKHSKIDYRSRICIKFIPPYITSEIYYNLCDEVIKEIGYFGKKTEALCAYFLTAEGLKYRKEIINKEWKDFQNLGSESSGEDAYIDSLKSEMDYIRNNGGDWIDD